MLNLGTEKKRRHMELQILDLTRQIDGLSKDRLEKTAHAENQQMRRNMSVYFDDPPGAESASARGRQEDIITAVKKLGVASCFDIAVETLISNRSVQAAIGDLVRKERLGRYPVAAGQIKKYRLPTVMKNASKNK